MCPAQGRQSNKTLGLKACAELCACISCTLCSSAAACKIVSLKTEENQAKVWDGVTKRKFRRQSKEAVV